MFSLLLCLFLLQVVGTVEQVRVSDAWGVVDEGATHGSLRRLAWGSKLGFAENGVNLGLGLCLFWV